VRSGPLRFSAADEQVQWTCESDERRSGARPSATRGRELPAKNSCRLGRGPEKHRNAAAARGQARREAGELPAKNAAYARKES